MIARRARLVQANGSMRWFTLHAHRTQGRPPVLVCMTYIHFELTILYNSRNLEKIVIISSVTCSRSATSSRKHDIRSLHVNFLMNSRTGRITPINRQPNPRNSTRIITGQKHRRPRNILHCRQPIERLLRLQHFPGLGVLNIILRHGSLGI
jgi:hypothetical protein